MEPLRVVYRRTMTIDLTRLNSLPPLAKGAHAPDSATACMMEAAAYVAGELWSDRPSCVCPVIATFASSINDAMPDDATRDHLLRPLIPLVIGTRGTADDERRRAFIAADFAVREAAPVALRAVGRTSHAGTLAELPRVIDAQTAADATAAADAAATTAADAARAAAYAATAAADAATTTADAYAAARAAAYAATAAADAAATAAADAYAAIWRPAADCLRRMCEGHPCSG